MARVVAVERSVLVQQISLGDEPAVDVAVTEVDGCLALVLDMRHFFAGAFAKGAVKDKEMAVAEDDAAFEEGGMFPGFAVERAGHLQEQPSARSPCKRTEGKTYGYGTAARYAADVEKLR